MKGAQLASLVMEKPAEEGKVLGSRSVRLSCNFGIITPESPVLSLFGYSRSPSVFLEEDV